MLKLIGMLSIIIGVSACTTTGEPTAAEVSQADAAQCQGYGLKPGTSDYARCRIEIDQGRQNRRAAIGMALLSRPPLPTYVPVAPPMRAPITCNSLGTGTMITTNCY